MGRYKVLSRNSKEVVVEATTATTTHSLLDEMAFDDVIPRWAADSAAGQNVSTQITVGETLTVRMAGLSLPSQQRDERKEKHMARRLMDTLVRQYAPDADTAWAWMRQAHEMGWEWGNHVLGGPTPKDPLGQRVNNSVATAFSNGAGVYVGICLVGGAVRWGWFRDHEWGPRGRDMVLSGDRSHHETPIAAMAEFALLGESAPKGGAPLEDGFWGSSDD